MTLTMAHTAAGQPFTTPVTRNVRKKPGCTVPAKNEAPGVQEEPNTASDEDSKQGQYLMLPQVVTAVKRTSHATTAQSRKRDSSVPLQKTSKKVKDKPNSEDKDYDRAPYKKGKHWFDRNPTSIDHRLHDGYHDVRLIKFCGVKSDPDYKYPDVPNIQKFRGLKEWFRMRFLVDIHQLFTHRKCEPTKTSNGLKRFHWRCGTASNPASCDYELVIMLENKTREEDDENKNFRISQRGSHTCQEECDDEDYFQPKLLIAMLVKLYYYDKKDLVILAPENMSHYFKFEFGLYITNDNYKLSNAIKIVKKFKCDFLDNKQPTLFDIWFYYADKRYKENRLRRSSKKVSLLAF